MVLENKALDIVEKTFRVADGLYEGGNEGEPNGDVKAPFDNEGQQWRALKSRGETHWRVSQSQVAESWDLVARSRLPTLERGRRSSWEPRD